MGSYFQLWVHLPIYPCPSLPGLARLASSLNDFSYVLPKPIDYHHGFFSLGVFFWSVVYYNLCSRLVTSRLETRLVPEHHNIIPKDSRCPSRWLLGR